MQFRLENRVVENPMLPAIEYCRTTSALIHLFF